MAEEMNKNWKKYSGYRILLWWQGRPKYTNRRQQNQSSYIQSLQEKYELVLGHKELIRDFENQVREVKQKLGREMRVMQENHEKWVNCLLKGTQKNAEENNILKID